jgi:hypothetical protein
VPRAHTVLPDSRFGCQDKFVRFTHTGHGPPASQGPWRGPGREPPTSPSRRRTWAIHRRTRGARWGVHRGGTLGRCALARADQRRCAHADTREAGMGRRRQRVEPNGNPDIRCAQGDSNLFHSAQDSRVVESGAPRGPPGVLTDEAMLARSQWTALVYPRSKINKFTDTDIYISFLSYKYLFSFYLSRKI